ncbi:Gfo/Idh/MocA family oxidoreductase [Caulobacter sp. CCNWLY153]|uniref:Gfo/Idh/MocA family protein n=1 Tax=unclassified Caulobacter TaxID=2648921 RepID=UPI002FEFE4BF
MRPLKIGVLGASRVAVFAMLEPAAGFDDIEVAAVAARDPERARAYATTHKIGRVEPDYEALISAPDLDLIYISTPANAHAEHALAAIAAGKPVLVEKPFALNAAQAQTVYDAGLQAGVPVFEAMHSPHHRLFARILEILDSGEIGPVRKIDAVFGAPIERNDPVRWSAELGGGALMDLGVYPLAWIRRIAGEAFTVISASQEREDGVDASFQAVLAFAAGVEARAYASMTIERPTARLLIEGERGVLMALNPLAPQMGHALTVKVGGQTRTETVDGASSYAEQLTAVRATLVEGADFPFPADDYVLSMRAIDMVRAAMS